MPRRIAGLNPLSGTHWAMAIALQATTDNIFWVHPFSHMAWAMTPRAVQTHLLSLQQRVKQREKQVDTLQGRVEKTSTNSSKPPSSDSPDKKPKGTRRTSSGTRGGHKGHPGAGPRLLSPTDVQRIDPGPCACGHGDLRSLAPYHTQQVIELPPITMDITPIVLQQGNCAGCGTLRKAHVPRAQISGSGPRLPACLGELAGRHRTSRRLIQDFCHAVFHIPLSLGARQQGIDRTSHALLPHYEAIATLARHATVGSIDATPWSCHNALQWLWTLTTDTVAFSLMHPHRSKEAFRALIEDWQGM